MWSYSRVQVFKQCPYKFKLKYLDEMQTIKVVNEDDPLLLGSAIHKGLELRDIDSAINYYKRGLNIYSDLAVNEEIKLKTMLEKALKIVPKGSPETTIAYNDFIGYADLIANGNLYDFKYSASDRFLDGAQLSVYKYFLAKIGIDVEKLYYVWIQKTAIRQRKTETLFEFRSRLAKELDNCQVKLIDMPYNKDQVSEYFKLVRQAKTTKIFEKCPSHLCNWCEFQGYCEEKEETMQLPKAERKKRTEDGKIKLWIYGDPFSGKTTFANQAEMPLFLNTDGNVDYIDSPAVIIKDGTYTEGRLIKKTFGWQTFKEALEELEKDTQGYKTVVVDLIESIYELCRTYMYSVKGWTHESDDPFRAYDIIRKEFLDVMKRLTNLNMNVILISHENTERDITKSSGSKVTSIRPNIIEKLAKQLSGMVDIVGRVCVVDGEHLLQLNTDETTFGGGRLQIDVKEIPLGWDEFEKTYKEALKNADLKKPKPVKKTARKVVKNKPSEPTHKEIADIGEVPAPKVETEQAPKTRERKRVVKRERN